MKNFLILHYGFEKPTAKDMDGWNQWFASIAERQLERAGFAGGREITHSGSEDLPFAKDSLTGYTLIQAESLDEAENIARDCPIVASTRVYEIRGG